MSEKEHYPKCDTCKLEIYDVDYVYQIDSEGKSKFWHLGCARLEIESKHHSFKRAY